MRPAHAPAVRTLADASPGWRVLLAFFALAAILTPVAGYFLYLPRAESDARRAAVDSLNLRIDMRLTRVSRWLADGLADARLVASYPSITSVMQSAPAEVDPHLTGMLRSLASIEGYERVLVVHGGHLVAQSDAAPLTPACTRARPGDPLVRFHMHGDRAFITFAAPVETPGFGEVSLEQGADTFLYPLMTREFLPFPSARAFFVERAPGPRYLTPLKDGLPVPRDVPAGDASALVADGDAHAGLHDGRGQEVLAVGRRLAGTPWTVVMKVDADEVLAESRRTSRAAWLATNAGVLTLALGVGMLFIWQRRRQAALLAFSQAHLGQALDHASDPILFLTEDGQICEANRRAHEFYGFPEGALRGLDTIEQLHFPEDRDRCRALMKRIMQESQLRFEARHRRADGSIVHVDVNAGRIDLDSHIRCVAVVRDITEHVAARSRAAQVNQMLRVRARVIEQLSGEGSTAELMDAACRTIVDDAELPLAWIGLAEPGGSIQVVARAGSAAPYLERVAPGWGADTAGSGPVGRSIREGHLHAATYGQEGFEPSPEIARAFGLTKVASAPILRAGQPVGALVVGGGAEIDFGSDLTGLLETMAGDLGLALSAIDAREARRAQSAALQESETRLRAIFDQSSIGIAICTLSGQIQRINPALERMLGYSEAEMQRMTFRAVTPEPDLAREEPLFRALAAGERDSYSLEKRFFRKDHRVVWGELTVSIVREGTTPLFVLAMARDVTDRRALQEQLVQSQKMEGIGRLAGGVAHDFNNLLTAILGYAEVLGDEIAADHPGQAFVLEIHKAGSRAAALTAQLLAFARRQIVLPRPLDLGDVVADAVPLLKRLVGNDVTITVEKEEGLWTVEADANQLQQILVNMAVNARDAMPNGGTIAIELANDPATDIIVRDGREARRGDFVRLSISDTGTGVSPEVMTHIFEPFFTTKEQGKGTGLGLATCHGIAVQSGGEIRVRSEVGHGATFDVLLPRAGAGAPTEVPAEQAAPGRGNGEVVLLAEDEAAVRGFAARCLTSRGYEVLEASSGLAALELARAHGDRIRLLITDVVMPGMGGRELAEKFGAFCPAAVLYVSGHPEGSRVRGLSDDERIDYLAKPFTADQLVRRVQELLESRRA